MQFPGLQPAYTITISQVIFQAFCTRTKIAIGKCEFNQNPGTLSVKQLILSEVVRYQPASLRKETPLCILPLFLQDVSRLLLRKKL